MDNIFLKELLPRLGTVKNPVLFTSSTFAVVIMYLARDYVLASSHPMANITGVCMNGSAILIFLIAICFYIYAYVKLPSTTQELIFLKEAEQAIERHKRSSPKKRSKRQPNAQP